MIKLTREEAAILAPFNLDYDYQKARAIREINRYAIANDSLLKLTQAILDGEWEVEEPLYYIHLMSGEGGYLNIGKHSGSKVLSTKYGSITYKTKFTRSEVKAIDPRYLEFLEEVE